MRTAQLASLRASSAAARRCRRSLRDQVAAAFAAGPAGEPLRPDRSLDRCDALGLRRRPLARGADWASDLEHAGVCSGRLFGACAVGGCGRALHCGRWSGAGVLAAFGSDGGAVCGRPAWRAAWVGGRADVPDRGPGAVAWRRGAGVSGAGRCAGEAARVPDRAWRDRGCAAAAAGRVAGGCGGAGGWRVGTAAGRLCGGGSCGGGRGFGRG